MLFTATWSFQNKSQVCHSLWKLFLPVWSQRWLLERPGVCVGTGSGEEQAGGLFVWGVLVLPGEEEVVGL